MDSACVCNLAPQLIHSSGSFQCAEQEVCLQKWKRGTRCSKHCVLYLLILFWKWFYWITVQARSVTHSHNKDRPWTPGGTFNSPAELKNPECSSRIYQLKKLARKCMKGKQSGINILFLKGGWKSFFLCFLSGMENNSIILICTYIHVNIFCYIYIFFLTTGNNPCWC